MQIAIDGPAGVGKSTLAKNLARYCGFTYIDTGAMYRGIAFLADKAGIPPQESKALEMFLEKISLTFKKIDQSVCLFNGEENLEKYIRSMEVSKIVSLYAKIPMVREAMTQQQRRIADEISVVMDGRDIGTVVLPHADYKFFLTASPEVRANRRVKDFQKQGIKADYGEILENIIKRDHDDANREIAPLRMAEDAIVINTDNQNEKEVFEKILQLIRK